MRLPRGLRWWELLPEVTVGAVLGFFVLTETSAVTSSLRSTKAILLMTAVGVIWAVARFVLVRFTRWPLLRLGAFAVAGFGVLAVVVFPAYDNTTVVETLPLEAGLAPSDPPTPLTAGPSSTVSPVPPVTSAPTAPTTTTTATTTTAATTTAATAAAAPGPVALRSSPLHGIDHRAEGTAVIYRQPDGSGLVGLEDIDIQPGPDYHVYVVAGADREDPDGGVRLDNLRGNKGTQYYAVPPDTDVTTGQWTVLVWCQFFAVPVAGATPI